MTPTPGSPGTLTADAPVASDGKDLLSALLADQQTFTAVDRFAQIHEAGDLPAQAAYYKSLIPTDQPKAGQQYAFEVNLDACTGCKGCVTACHNLNGLDYNEAWREVGLLTSNDVSLPVVQHITTACHHCVEPGCLEGCPVMAYDKDPVTGIVKHLDDQCIGCQYCILKCPYDVPKYNPKMGIVRKCDMCTDRLAEGEAPACVQACPDKAISIKLVDTVEAQKLAEKQDFLADAPDSTITTPTTKYVSKRLAGKTLNAPQQLPRAEHGHLPLVVMLTLTQLGVGALLAERLLLPFADHWTQLITSAMGFGIGMFGMTCAILHLGRPMYAYRAFLGWRTSWLSREIIAFNGFAAAVHAHITMVALQNNLIPAFVLDKIPFAIPTVPLWITGWASVITGLGGVFCSMMIYIDTKRPCWDIKNTVTKFGLTGIILGLAATLVALCGGAILGQTTADPSALMLVSLLLVASTIAKLAFEMTHLTYNSRALPMLIAARVGLGVIGGVVLPLLLLMLGTLPQPLILAAISATLFGTLTLGELAERYLYFAASDALRMPGIQIADGGHH
ncbi:MAG TPA: molybdopterin oxidoreductase [Phycisphaerales bacterium]|nr:molybdopterin oxidoreductase [Phycisphaerales bacterium]HCD33429.1 molybdopterin oxidoreductase [Phycisphaerales bacterium]|tara:strand:+ start:6580 stop:8265 length:1686 start_codon:yes stop_codon:yes gene_type:complete